MAQGPVHTVRFGMAGPADLLDKLRHDIERLESGQTRHELAYAVFDCATDCWSMRDWCWEWFSEHKNYRSNLDNFTKDILLPEVPELEACRMIATSYKHYCVRRGEPVDIHLSMPTLWSKKLIEDGGGQIEHSEEQLPTIYWRGDAVGCDEFFSSIYDKFDAFLRRHNIELRGTYLERIFPRED